MAVMTARLPRLAALGTAALLVADGAAGQGAGDMKEPTTAGPPAIIQPNDPGQILAKKDLIGDTVVAKDGVEIGSVEDLILDRNGHVKGIVVAAGGFLGMGAKSIGISVSAIDISSAKNQNAVLVNLSSAEIERASAATGEK